MTAAGDQPDPKTGVGADRDAFVKPVRSGYSESLAVDAGITPSPQRPALPRRTGVAVKGSKESGDWPASVSKASGQPAAVLAQVAPAEWAAQHGNPAPPAR